MTDESRGAETSGDPSNSTPTNSPFEVVSFLSDLGRADEKVGVIEAVIYDLAPHASMLHLTHDITPFDVRAGSLALARSIAYVPAGVVLAIVDPHGSAHRRPIAIEVAGGAGVLVGPDNGLLAPAVALAGGAERAVVLDNPAVHLSDASTLFRGRDVYAPVVAALLNGADLDEVGTAVDPGELFPGTIPLPRVDNNTLIGEVLWIDRFGNVQLNVGPDELGDEWGRHVQIRLSGLGVDDTVRTAYRTGGHLVAASPDDRADVPAGAIELIDDPYGLMTLTMLNRSAAIELGVAAGDRVVLAPIDGTVDDGTPATASTPVELGRRDTPESTANPKQ